MKCSVSIERCYACERFFGCDTECAPIVLADGKPEPVCRDCIDEANRQRCIYGTPQLHIHPGAYVPIGTNANPCNEYEDCN